MRLKSVYISQYKNLKEFTLPFDGSSFIDVFVGKNGTGKSNLFEVLIEIFRHLYEFDKTSDRLSFEYEIVYEMNDTSYKVQWKDGQLNFNGEERRSVNKSMLPDNVLIYYSGHNETVTDIVSSYQEKFSKRIKKADFDESRRFIGIGAEYKGLLLAILLLQNEDCIARKFICKTLGIQSDMSGIKLVLKRPVFSKKNFDIEEFDASTHFWGTAGITKDFLNKLQKCIKKEFKHSDIYDRVSDTYSIEINRELFQSVFADHKATEQFRLFDNLKTLDMLADISAPVILENGVNADISQFSDGQFQSVYIYSIIELFKDRNCITLLDEPDSFLHPEWQFEFLKQVFEITDNASKSNHVLMSSHSASTITKANESMINLFEFDGNKVVVSKINKADVIKSLSAGLITFSESEARLNINHVLKSTTGAILFTEGITDEMILETAWTKLYPTDTRNFEIQNAFSCGFLRNLMKDEEIYRKDPERKFFSIFDFDVAFNDWNQLGQDIQDDPCRCLAKKYRTYESYALLLPVPDNPTIRKQVINPISGGNYGNRSLLTIELLFYGIDGLDTYFVVDTERTDGFIKFISDTQKVPFAEDVVPTLNAACFEVFRPMFEFVKSKC